MKNAYLGILAKLPRPWLWMSLLIASLLVPEIGFSQVFTETMGSTGVEGGTIANHSNNRRFDNDGFIFRGDSRISLVNPSTSAGVNILFPSTNATGVTFIIENISTSTFSNSNLKFDLLAPAGASVGAVNGDFRVAYSVGTVDGTGAVTYSAYTNLPYTYSSASGAYGTAQIAMPSGFNNKDVVALRFTRIATAAALGDFRLDNVALSLPNPTLTINPAFNNFGSQVVNTPSAGVPFAIQGNNLGTTPVTVTAPVGFQVSATQNGEYASSLELVPTIGALNTTVYVQFLPTSAVAYNGNITAVSGSAGSSAFVAGQGVAPTPVLTATPTSLPDFGSVQVGQTSTTSRRFTVTGNNLTGPVTVTAPAGFQIRQGANQYSTASIILTPTSGSVNAPIDVRFAPTQQGNYNSQIGITSSGAVNAAVNVSGTATPQPTTPFIVANPTSLDFGTVSNSGSSQTLSFEVNAGNLIAPLVLTGSNNNIVFRDASAGGSFTNGPLTINPTAGTVSSRTIEVRLVATVGGGAFTGNISLSSTNAPTVVVNIVANNTIGGSSTINPTGELQLFSTVPGVPSAVQSYQLGASNLLQGVTVTAPQYFQVSLTSDFAGITTTGNTIVVERNSGNDIAPSVTVYVRFVPPVAVTTSDLITNSSNPATGKGIPVAGTSEPSIQILNAFQEIRNVIINTTSGVQSVNVKADRVRQPITISRDVINNTANRSNTPQFELSLDNVVFTSTVTLTPVAGAYSISQPIYIRYRPTYLGVAQSNLQFQSADFANQGVQTFPTDGLLSGRSIDTEPTKRSVASVVRSGETATVSFNLPANYAAMGYGENRLIVASTNPTLPAGSQPADGTPYGTGNQTYGNGPQVAPGYYVVYSGDESVITVAGLNPQVTYYFYTFEFNNIEASINLSIIGAENYLQPPVPTVIEGIPAPGTPLPVDLVSFTAKLRNNKVALNWVTASEKNNASFVVERSQDARTFTAILTREGKGNTETRTSYDAVDENPLTGTSYYRLKQVDFDGTAKYSSPVAVTNLGAKEVAMYPNPTEDVLNIQLAGSMDGVPVSVSDLTGRVVLTQVLNGNGQLNLGGLRSGTYLVTVGEGNAKVTRRIVKK